MNLKDRAFLAGPESTGHRYGERLLPICIREIAEQDPERLFAEFIDPPLLLENNSDNIWRLTFREFSRMIDRAAWWLDAKFRENGLTKGTTFAYLGRADVRYLVILVAAMKCGYPVLFSSHLNGTDALLRLMSETSAKAFVFADGIDTKEAQERCSVPCLESLRLKGLVESDLAGEGLSEFPCSEVGKQAAETTVAYFHTSGTTGFPKPIRWTNAHIALTDKANAWPDFQGRGFSKYYRPDLENGQRPRRYQAGVMYHASMVSFLAGAVFTGVILVVPPLHWKKSELGPDTIATWLQRANCRTALMLPNILEQGQRDMSLQKQLLKLERIYYVGASLPLNVALTYLPHVKLESLWGTTEAGYLPSYEPDHEDWEYMCINPDMHGIQWQEVTPSDYAMAWARDCSSEDHSHQPIFYVFPDAANWSSGDTFAPHPTKPHHWRFSGRGDDNFWMSDVQMVNPRPFEQRVREDPGVISATMFGENRPSCCLVVELRDDADIEAVWPSIEKASRGMRSSEQVHRSMVIVVKKEKPVPKTVKGDVKRKDLAELYSDEIEACYNQKA